MSSRRLVDHNDDIIADINVIPLVDISLVLLIIFMITANFLNSYLNVKLPEAKYAEESAGTDPYVATVTLTRDGPIYLENKIVTMAELKEKLADRLKRYPKMSVILNVDKRVNFGGAVTVLDALQSLGIKNTSFSTVDSD